MGRDGGLDVLEEIGLSAFEFVIQAEGQLLLPEYKGSTLRGAFGHAFKQVACPLKGRPCPTCLLGPKCAYFTIFETPPPPDARRLRKYSNIPHPFVLLPPSEPKQVYAPGESLSFGLRLVGRAADYLPYFVLAFSELGKVGLGKGRGCYRLQEVFGLEGQSRRRRLYSKEKGALLGSPTTHYPGRPRQEDHDRKALSLRFLTPTRIRYQEDLCLDLEFHILARSLMRRLSALAYFHCGLDPEGWDFRGWIARAEGVGLSRRELRWYDWERYSARQDRRMMLGGFVGEASFVGDLGPFMPLIRLGEWLHVGKGTSFGLGRYEVVG